MQLLEFTHEIHTNMQSTYQTDVLFIDFSKVFDRVPHCRLLAKLFSLNIGFLTLSRIRNFTLRQHYTSSGTFRSDLRDATPRGPQAPALGPMPFLIYNDNLPSNTSSFIPLFADDCLYTKLESPIDRQLLQNDLNTSTTGLSIA